MIWFVVIGIWILIATLITVGQHRRAQWPQTEERDPPILPGQDPKRHAEYLQVHRALRDRDRDVRTSLNWPR